MQPPGIPSLNVTGDVARLKHIPRIHEMRFHYVKTAHLGARQGGENNWMRHPDEREQSGAASERWEWKSVNSRRADHYPRHAADKDRLAVNGVAGAEHLRAGETVPAGGFKHYQPRSPEYGGQADDFTEKKQIV